MDLPAGEAAELRSDESTIMAMMAESCKYVLSLDSLCDREMPDL